MFLGESGVGKEMFARNLHKLSRRADQSMPENFAGQLLCLQLKPRCTIFNNYYV